MRADIRGSCPGAKAERPGLRPVWILRKDDVLVVLDLNGSGGLRELDHSHRPAGRAGSRIPGAECTDGHDNADRARFPSDSGRFAEMERNIIRQRVNEGLVAARGKGRKGGDPGS